MSHEPRPDAALHPPLRDPVQAPAHPVDLPHDPSLSFNEYRQAEAMLAPLVRVAKKCWLSHGQYRVTMTIGGQPVTLSDENLPSVLRRAEQLYDSYFPPVTPASTQEAA